MIFYLANKQSASYLKDLDFLCTTVAGERCECVFVQIPMQTIKLKQEF